VNFFWGDLPKCLSTEICDLPPDKTKKMLLLLLQLQPSYRRAHWQAGSQSGEAPGFATPTPFSVGIDRRPPRRPILKPAACPSPAAVQKVQTKRPNRCAGACRHPLFPSRCYNYLFIYLFSVHSFRFGSRLLPKKIAKYLRFYVTSNLSIYRTINIDKNN